MSSNPAQIVAEFLGRFYCEEPSDEVAATRAMRSTIGRYEYRWRLAESFLFILGDDVPGGLLQSLVREKANRFCRTDGEAREFLRKVYTSNTLHTAIDPDDLGG
ncbi:hypothetical protein ACFVH0_18295 [Streptomyces sp. NPDC127117]|uniref:hypothetical protein n=1 Tax=Streptomyces sp. NPDC127117 TaxID=3345368 RepID=UPI003625F2A6